MDDIKSFKPTVEFLWNFFLNLLAKYESNNLALTKNRVK